MCESSVSRAGYANKCTFYCSADLFIHYILNISSKSDPDSPTPAVKIPAESEQRKNVTHFLSDKHESFVFCHLCLKFVSHLHAVELALAFDFTRQIVFCLV